MTPARRTKALRAFELRCQGLTLRQIAEIMGCAHSTVAAYLRDLERELAGVTQSLAAEQLLLALLRLADSDDDRHPRDLATARELRLLVESCDRIGERRSRRQDRQERRERQDRQDRQTRMDEIERDNEPPDDFQPRTPADYDRMREENFRGILLGSPQAHGPLPGYDSYLSARDAVKTEPQPDESEQIRTNLNKTEQDSDEIPANHAESSEPDQNSPPPPEPPRPRKPFGTQYPYSKDNPVGYIPPQDPNSPMIRRFLESSNWR